jgi:hypothetical protein
MNRQPSDSELRQVWATGRAELWLYLAAGVAYVTIGVLVPEFLFSWLVCIGYLLLCVVALPIAVRRFRR